MPQRGVLFRLRAERNHSEKLYEYEIIDPSTELDLRDRIIGAQANTWCEWIPSRERLYYMIAPRIMALSELVLERPV